jgi:hypothetical protein
LRSLKLDGHPEFGARLYEALTDVRTNLETLEQQTNSNLSGTPAAPPGISGLKVIPHPQGVQFLIQHDADFYQGIQYEIDASSNGVTHTYDVGSSRNGILPVGPLTARYQVRARYPTGTSTAPFVLNREVAGGGGSSQLLPSQGAGTTKTGQPPGFGGPFRGGKPPAR